MFRIIDDFIIDRLFQPLSEFLQHHTGKNCFWYAAQCALLWLVLAMFESGLDLILHFNGTPMKPGGWFNLALLPLIVIGMYRDFNRWMKQDSMPAMNPHRLTYLWLRSIALLVTAFWAVVYIITPPDVVRIIAVIAFVGMFYFDACTPPPPRPILKEALHHA